MKRIFYLLTILAFLAGCADDDSFSTSAQLRLTFSADTIQLDTLFSATPSKTYAFWVYNRHDDGVRIATVQLQRRNQSGFRVNVDGSYLDNTSGSAVRNLEIRRNDSVLVFVELTAPLTRQDGPVAVDDNLVFTLESGAEQRVNLRAWAWDAIRLTDARIERDSLIETATPIIICGGLTVAEGARLTVRNTTLYFHDQAGIDVHGQLTLENCVLRGDRLDRMFDYLPYDRVSGQWRGLRFYATSAADTIRGSEIRNASDAIVVDSAALDPQQPRLTVDRSVVHNAKGYGIRAVSAYIRLLASQVTNTWHDCVAIVGGKAEIVDCTLAQFYPFDADRGKVLYFSDCQGPAGMPLASLYCEGSILTGYEKDVWTIDRRAEDATLEFLFANSLLRSPRVETADSVRFSNIIWESPTDSIEGKKHFRTIDEENLSYDFRLDSLSTAWGLGCYREAAGLRTRRK